MNPAIMAIRAIATQFAYRIYWPITIVLSVIGVAMCALMIWLITMTAWWLLLAIPVFASIIVGAMALIIGHAILQGVTPMQSKAQQKMVSRFVDKIQRLSEITQTPKIFLLFHTIRNVASPGKEGFLQSVIDDTSSLQKDYQEIVDSFRTNNDL